MRASLLLSALLVIVQAQSRPEARPESAPRSGARLSYAELLAFARSGAYARSERAASAEERQRLFALAFADGTTEEVVAAFSDAAAAAAPPVRARARLDLADAYWWSAVSNINTSEFVRFAMLADDQFDDVLKTEPDDWDALYGKFSVYAASPAFMNRSYAAVAGFNALRKRQEVGHPLPKYKAVYEILAMIYVGDGNTVSAIETIKSGLSAFPNDPVLLSELSKLQTLFRKQSNPGPPQR